MSDWPITVHVLHLGFVYQNRNTMYRGGDAPRLSSDATSVSRSENLFCTQTEAARQRLEEHVMLNLLKVCVDLD